MGIGKYLQQVKSINDKASEIQMDLVQRYMELSKAYGQEKLKTDYRAQGELVKKLFDGLLKKYEGSHTKMKADIGFTEAEFLNYWDRRAESGRSSMDLKNFMDLAETAITYEFTVPRKALPFVWKGREPASKDGEIKEIGDITGMEVKDPQYLWGKKLQGTMMAGVDQRLALAETAHLKDPKLEQILAADGYNAKKAA